jgi:hypothetical protein
VLIAVLALAAALAALVWWGPITVSDKRVMLGFLLGRGIEPPSATRIAMQLRVPPGLAIHAYSTDVPLARVIAFTSAGDLIVSRTRAGAVSLLERDRDGDGRADGHRVLLDDLDGPHGLALHEGWLYVAERTGVARVRFDESTGQLAGPYTRILTGLTTDGFHQTKTIGFGPDGWLYLSQGSTCNVCIEKDERRATVMRMRPDGSQPEIIAKGLRNSVGFDWAPWDGTMYATENGRDLLGDDFPPDELNRIEPGHFYGWPYVNGAGVPDDFGAARIAAGPCHPSRIPRAARHSAFISCVGSTAGFERTGLVAPRVVESENRPMDTRWWHCSGNLTAHRRARFPHRIPRSRRDHRPACLGDRGAGRRDLRFRRLRGRGLSRDQRPGGGHHPPVAVTRRSGPRAGPLVEVWRALAHDAEPLPGRCLHDPPGVNLHDAPRAQRLEAAHLRIDVVRLDVEVDAARVTHRLHFDVQLARRVDEPHVLLAFVAGSANLIRRIAPEVRGGAGSSAAVDDESAELALVHRLSPISSAMEA